MSWSGQRRGYHHGNLREALVEAALALIGETGPAGLTIAEAARRAGVSPGAPYRHFRDAEALLAEVALRGFESLARSEPAYYAAMFEARVDAEAHPGLLAASDRAFAVLRDAADMLTAAAPGRGRPPALMVALHVWAMSHGIASLFCRPDAGRRKLPMSPEELLEAGVLLYLHYP
jgi:AcrR family transcriptional regulator